MSLRGPFGRHIRHLRTMAGLTQAQLAELAELSHDQVSMIERGRRAASFEAIEGLARAFECHPRDLFDFDWPEH